MRLVGLVRRLRLGFGRGLERAADRLDAIVDGLLPRMKTAITILLMNLLMSFGFQGVHGSLEDVAGELGGVVQGFQSLGLVLAALMLGAGIILRFLPYGSFTTKSAAGRLIDDALILGGLLAVGVWLIYYAGYFTKTAVGEGEIPEPGGPWRPPT